MTALDSRTEALLDELSTPLDDAEIADFEAELDRSAASAAVERDARLAEQRARRVRRRIIGTLLAVVLAVAGLIGYRAYEQHLAEVAAAEAAHARVVAAAEQARLDDAFYAARADAANTAAIAAWEAVYAARWEAATDAIEADLDAAREVLDESKGRVLAAGKDSRTDLADAIDAREALLVGGSLLALEHAADTPLDTAAVTEAVAAWEAEQARIAAEKAERERQARLEAERQARVAAQQQSAQQQTPSSTSPTPSTPSTPSTPRVNATQAAAENAAARYGVRVKWVTTTSPCGHTGHANPRSIYVAGCSTGSGTIQLSVGGVNPANLPEGSWAQAAARATALHETAHELIARQCGTVAPPITAGRFEHVTDAYPHLYLGTGTASGGYGYTAADAEIARLIHAGVCS